MRAAIYCRISQDRDDSRLGVERQEEDCRALCDRKHWEIAGVYVDNDQSAYTGKHRPEYQRMCDDVKDGAVDVVVCWHPDRLHRHPRELEEFILLIEAAGATVASVTAGDWDLATPEGRLVARIVGSVARKESEDKSRRLRRKHLQLAQQGQPTGGGTRPFGFDTDYRTIRPPEAALISEAAHRLLAGDTLRGVCADWNRRGEPTVNGGPWATFTLRRLITSARVCGWREYHDQFLTPAVWPAILTRDTVDELRAVLLDPGRRQNLRARRYLLAGIARCALCDATLVARPRSDKTRCYVCAKGPGFHGCGRIRVVAEPLEAWTARMVLLGLDTPDLAARAAARPGTDVDDPITEIRACEAKLAELAGRWAGDILTRAEWMTARQSVEARLTAARRRLARTARQTQLRALRGQGAALGVAWPALPFDRRRAIIDGALEALPVGPARPGLARFDPGRLGDPVWRT